MLEQNPRLRLELRMDRWEYVRLKKFLTSSANWIEVPEETIKQVAGSDIEQEQELQLSARPFAEIISESAWEKGDGYWDKINVVLELETHIDLLIPHKVLPVPQSFIAGLFRSLKLFPRQMSEVDETP